MVYPKIFLKSHREKRIFEGHLWVFSNEIGHAEGTVSAGEIVDIFSAGKMFLGRGFYNPHSLISVRILTRHDEIIDENFISKRIETAQKFRNSVVPDETFYRLIFGESDFLPGLVVDRYENCFVIQSYCLGMDILLSQIIEGLKNSFKVDSIVLKNDSSLRTLENLKEEIRVIEGNPDFPISISQKWRSEMIRFMVHPLEGQKSGFFFDQRENRERLSDDSEGKIVLDCFSYTGGFGIYAAKAGAKEVTCVDSSENACSMMKKNFELNHVQGSVIHDDVFDLLLRFQKEKRKFDIIVLDPPAFAKSKKNLFGALRKYRQLNEFALSLLTQDGVLFSCSCSHHVNRADFLKMIGEAAFRVKRTVRLIEMRGASKDHPVLPSMPETEYLKCAILRAD